MRRNHPSKHRNKYQRRLASALIGGVLIFGIYLVHLGNTDTWQETGCAVVGSRVIPEGVQSERHIVMIYRGQYQLANVYRYLSEAYVGYHFNKWYGINVDAGLFMSYIVLNSYY